MKIRLNTLWILSMVAGISLFLNACQKPLHELSAAGATYNKQIAAKWLLSEVEETFTNKSYDRVRSTFRYNQFNKPEESIITNISGDGSTKRVKKNYIYDTRQQLSAISSANGFGDTSYYDFGDTVRFSYNEDGRLTAISADNVIGYNVKYAYRGDTVVTATWSQGTFLPSAFYYKVQYVYGIERNLKEIRTVIGIGKQPSDTARPYITKIGSYDNHPNVFRGINLEGPGYISPIQSSKFLWIYNTQSPWFSINNPLDTYKAYDASYKPKYTYNQDGLVTAFDVLDAQGAVTATYKFEYVLAR
jgi:hypothetical protein